MMTVKWVIHNILENINMKRIRILIFCFIAAIIVSGVSIYAKSARLTWSGQDILGLASRGSFTVGGKTTVKIENTVVRAKGTPSSVNGRLSLRKKGFWGYSSIYTMNLNSLGYDSWYYTINNSGRYDVYIESYKVYGITNPLDCDGAIY